MPPLTTISNPTYQLCRQTDTPADNDDEHHIACTWVQYVCSMLGTKHITLLNKRHRYEYLSNLVSLFPSQCAALSSLEDARQVWLWFRIGSLAQQTDFVCHFWHLQLLNNNNNRTIMQLSIALWSYVCTWVHGKLLSATWINTGGAPLDYVIRIIKSRGIPIHLTPAHQPEAGSTDRCLTYLDLICTSVLGDSLAGCVAAPLSHRKCTQEVCKPLAPPPVTELVDTKHCNL